MAHLITRGQSLLCSSSGRLLNSTTTSRIIISGSTRRALAARFINTSTTVTGITPPMTESPAPTPKLGDTQATSVQHFTWQKGPLTLIATPKAKTGSVTAFSRSATSMAVVHNCVVRGFNTVYQSAPHVPASELKNFIEYAYQVSVMLDDHHIEEEAYLFPGIEKAFGEGVMQESVDEHAAFLPGLKAYQAYITTLLQNPSTLTTNYDATRLRTLITDFKDPLQYHLQSEVDQLYALNRYGSAREHEMVKASNDAHSQTNYKRDFFNLPVVLMNHDRTFENGNYGNFPPMPKPVGAVLRSVASSWHWGRWKYASCDSSQNPKELPYTGEEKS